MEKLVNSLLIVYCKSTITTTTAITTTNIHNTMTSTTTTTCTWGRRMEKLVTSLLASFAVRATAAEEAAVTSSVLCRLPWLAILPDSTYRCQSSHLTFVQMHLSHSWLLNSYKACIITAGVIGVCLDCRVAPHCVKHLLAFHCHTHSMQLNYGMIRKLWNPKPSKTNHRLGLCW